MNMNQKNIIRVTAVNDQWKFIISMAALALINPVMNMLGIFSLFGRPAAGMRVTMIISAIWIIYAVRKNIKQPLVTLMLTGATYGTFTIIISAVSSLALTGRLQGPITSIFAFVTVIAINTVWGLIAGIIASMFKVQIR